jgi:hypothetical protein
MISESHEQSAYRVALVSLIKSIPQTAYMHEMLSVSSGRSTSFRSVTHPYLAYAVIDPWPGSS